MIKLSIVIPIYNAESFLEKTLKSVIVRDDEIEYILINDGSVDKSLEICKKFEDENVSIINNENHGVSYTRNCGIQKANGKYIMFVDADDLLIENWNHIVKKYLDLEYDLVIFNKNVKNISKDELYKKIVGYNSSDFLAGPWSKLYKKDLIVNKNIKFDNNLINGEDLIFNLLFLNNVNDYFIDNNCIYRYRVNNSSATRKFNEKIFESDFYFQNQLKQILPYNLNSRQLLLDYSIQNACFIFMKRLSYLNSYSTIKKYLSFFKDNKYYEIKKVNIKDYKIKLVLYLLKYHLYYICYLVFKINKKRDIKENFFIDI